MHSLEPGKYFAFTTRSNCRRNILANDVQVGNNQALAGKTALRPYKAIWDTGATHSVVTEKVATECGLIPVTKAKVVGIHVERISNVYLIDLHLPNNVTVTELQVTEASSLSGPFEVLVDWISSVWGILR